MKVVLKQTNDTCVDCSDLDSESGHVRSLGVRSGSRADHPRDAYQPFSDCGPASLHHISI